MVDAFICPRCHQPLRTDDRYCQNCGLDLAVEATIGELLADENLQTGDARSLEPEILVPRLGDALVSQGKITPKQLEVALRYQAEQATLGRSVRLGRALIELGYLDEASLDEAITLQILQLQEALKQANRELERRVEQRTQELRQALLRVSELNQIKANFIANVSHELRTPLTLLRGYLDMMKDGAFGEVTAEQAQALDALLRSATRLEKLIDDLILFAYAERGELTLTLTNNYLQDIAAQVVENHRYSAKVKGISLEARIEPDLPPVHCDRDRIAWVMDELINNAIKFSSAGGKVSLAILYHQGIVTVSVHDQGIGIPAQRLAEIFEPFHQLDGSTTRRYGGTGLGLALVTRIIEAHGAQLRVESEVGKGSLFEFSLPAIGEDHARESSGYR
ncbi:MAG: Phosphate regulon sensor protein PhoR (SphS) [Anaerolineae bacterium]|nr:MAG: Phosphate regulon sensor protein PhoR (SphS) [Anaerolineae bacterium]